jgi:hypothetical protein
MAGGEGKTPYTKVSYSHYCPDLPEPTWKPLAGSPAALVVPFRAHIEVNSLRVTIVIDVVDGAPSCTSYTVTTVDGGGLENRTTEVARGISIRDLLASALRFQTWEAFPDPDATGGLIGRPGAPLDLTEAVMGSVRRRRVPVDDDRLREVAEAYRERWRPGNAAAFAESLLCSERQMYRLLKLARERGFLTDGDNK